jgi:hypothetical protein
MKRIRAVKLGGRGVHVKGLPLEDNSITS